MCISTERVLEWTGLDFFDQLHHLLAVEYRLSCWSSASLLKIVKLGEAMQM